MISQMTEVVHSPQNSYKPTKDLRELYCKRQPYWFFATYRQTSFYFHLSINLWFYLKPGRKGSLVLHLSLKFYSNVFLFVGWTTLWTLLNLNFDCLIKLSIEFFQPLIAIYWRDNIVYHHWGSLVFISYCLIPLYPWSKNPHKHV